MAGMFQINPRTGKPYTVDEAMAVGMPQQGGAQPEPMMQQPLQQPMPQPTAPAGGMFGQAAKPKGGAWRDVLGSVFDVMSAAGGGQPVYWGTKMAEKQKADAWGQELEKINAMAAENAKFGQPDQATALQRNIEYIRSLNPRLSDQEAFDIAKLSMVRPIAGAGGAIYDPMQLTEAARQQSDEPQEGEIATNPQTGESVMLRNGQWVPVK